LAIAGREDAAVDEQVAEMFNRRRRVELIEGVVGELSAAFGDVDEQGDDLWAAAHQRVHGTRPPHSAEHLDDLTASWCRGVDGEERCESTAEFAVFALVEAVQHGIVSAAAGAGVAVDPRARRAEPAVGSLTG
jgi:hypothetical protein